ncbi:MAG: N-6 DNA methylase [Clostridiaceae bacterium]|nr:N-6 DNA methylase [Clostridiaceae bacterium]
MPEQITCPDAIRSLVERFEYHRAAYLRGQYNETQLRREFIDPFFRALGWDVDNQAGLSEAYKEVAHEDPIRVRGQTNYLDYSFRIGGVRKFIVEAKKPSVKIQDDTESALQLRKYAWNSKLKLSILTNFEEFAVYDCTKPLRKGDSAGTARICHFTYRHYPEKWEWITKIFSQKCILKGAFDKYADSETDKKGTMGVDEAFLGDIEAWREKLARNIVLRNSSITIDELNMAIQQIIDRIIFLRISEDRGIEPYGTLQGLLEGGQTYSRLCDLFRHADDKYNSGLFYFQEQRGRSEEVDTLTPSLKIDDVVLKAIIRRLYFPESPYEFSAIPADILGHVYEQFLGKIIRLKGSHRVEVEEKQEVRKAGGVYYTPTYIVDYIVRQSVGEFVHGKTPKEVSGITILDPACGSGSFLIGAYQFLLNWHRDWYIEHLVPTIKEKGATSPEVQALLPPTRETSSRRGRERRRSATQNLPIYKAGNGTETRTRSDWKLTTAERKRILLNNIYGVDIDPQAVEVTKLSLLLKVLEDESEESVSKQLTLFAERALPSLHENIKCGNSLVAPDIYDDFSIQPSIEERKKLNVFDWEREFAEIVQRGGFNVVIGNPPWGSSFSPSEQAYLKKNYSSARGRNIDSYAVFIEFGLKMLNKKGQLSYITPDTLLRKDDHLSLRNFVFDRYSIVEMIETGPVFPKVRDTWALVFRMKNEKPTDRTVITHKNISRFIVSAEERLNKFDREEWDHVSQVSQALWKNRPNQIVGYLSSIEDQQIISKIEDCIVLGALSELFSISRGEEGSKYSLNECEGSDFWMVIPHDIERYNVGPGVQILKDTLNPTKVEKCYTHPKIWITRIQKPRWKQRLVCAFDERQNSAGMKTLQTIVSTRDRKSDLIFLLGVLNSKLMNYYCTNFLADDMNKSYLMKLPICPIDPDDANYARMNALVRRIFDLNHQLGNAKAEHDKTFIKREIEATDNRIDMLVYELYGLSEEEIKMIEQAM